MAVNVRGVFLGCKFAIPAMLEQGAGSIINIASFVAILGCSVPQDAYTASKGAVLALTRSLAVQFAGQGVRTNSISPGPIETPLLMDWLLKDEAAKALAAEPQPDGPLRPPRGDRQRRDLPRVGRVALDQRGELRDRRRHHGQLLLAGDAGTAGERRWPRTTRTTTPLRSRRRAALDDAPIANDPEAWAADTVPDDPDEELRSVPTGVPVDDRPRRLAVGIDVGGSGIKASAVDLDTGELVGLRHRVPTPQPSVPEAVIASIRRMVHEAREGDRPRSGGARSASAFRPWSSTA